MFEKLFKQPAVLARYREAPFAHAREQFLKQCANNGYSHSMLCKIAWILLSVAHNIDLTREKITPQEIKLAIENRKRFKHLSKDKQDSQSSYQLFNHIVTEWVRSFGYLEPSNEIKKSFEPYISAFAKYLRDERGLSSITISTRCERLRWFFDGLEPHQQSIHSISISDLDSFIASKGKQGWKRSSLASLASSLRSFLYYAEGQGWCTPGIASVIESPRIYINEGFPKGPNWDEVQRLLSGITGDKPADIRDKAILMLLAIYGLRRGEVEQLRLDDLDWEGEKIVVKRPKQLRTQCYPMVHAVGEAILRYLQKVRLHSEYRNLFLTLAAPIRPLSAGSISAIAHARLSALGVTLPRRGAHCLRHACANHLLESGFSLKQIGDHLGHRTVNSTLCYTKIDLNGLRQIAELNLGGLL
jgi:site-specific recombinase XerD